MGAAIPEEESETESETGSETGSESERLDGLNAGLHAMSQPLTALLCMLHYGSGLAATEEMKRVFAGGLEQCERLLDSVRTMQTLVAGAVEREGAEGKRWR